MAENNKIKIRDIEGTQDEVLGFFEKSGLDIGDYLNSAKTIKVSFWYVVIASLLFIIFSCIASYIDAPKIKTIFTILSLAFAFANIGFIYMSWKCKTLTGIIALGEMFIFAIALHIYTPKDVVSKIEDSINKYEK